jgi:hypothetical protein
MDKGYLRASAEAPVEQDCGLHSPIGCISIAPRVRVRAYELKGEQNKMAYEYREPDVVETHSREVVVDRDTGSSGAVIGIVLAALLVLGLIGYFAWWSPRGGSDTNVRVETPADSGRAQDIRVDAPDVNVTTPDIHMPDVNVTPPDVNVTPPTGSNSNSGSNDNAGG